MKPQKDRKQAYKTSTKKRRKTNLSRILFLVIIGMITIGLVGSSFIALL